MLRLKEVGLTKIYTGVESGCLSQLKRYNRSYTLEDMDHVINLLLDQLEIEIDIGFIMFDPYLTLAEMQQNLDYFSEKGLLEGNQWPFRPLAINDGAPLLSEMKSHPAKSKLLGKRNIDLMSYGYSFIEPNVQRIFTEIDQLSEQTREIFYALKQISKLHFAPWKQDEETRIAFELVKENGAIYLQLMKDLVRFYQDKNTDNCELFIIKAKKKIDELVLLCKKHIADRNIKTDAEDLTFKINHYLGEF
ncbi:MAG: hypothetical protein GY757_18025 [bacterium]|nr:hypothetical protein [bacterium]